MAFEYAIVLTGSIATGKSSAVKRLSTLGFEIIDADKVAHQVLNEQSIKIAEMFGEGLVQNGVVDRKALGEVVFSNTAKRKVLENLLHPLIYEEIARRSSDLDKKKKPYLVDIPLFFEGGRYPIEKSIVVYATKKQQLERLMARNHYSKEEAQSRIETQISVEEKRKKASFVIDNSGTLMQLEAECERVAQEILTEGTLNDSN